MTMPLEENENATALKRALFALKDMRAKLDAVERAKTEPIAIIGMGCRFPGGANSPDIYWKILSEGIDVIREVPPERWNIDEYYDPDMNAPGKMYVRKSGFLDQVDQFEPQFFGISPREAMSMDPQQRLLLEVTWEALEYAGIVPASLAGSQTGVFIGMSTQDYSGMIIKQNDLSIMDAYVGTGTSFSVGAGRIAYILGVHGPVLAMDTACSSSLVAIHLAVQSLRAGQSNLALAGGVSLILAPEGTVSMSKSHALSPDGYCKTFDASANGYARGEGSGVVVLKRLSDALADGDNILALIRGSAINHDGRSSGLTVPNGQAQQAVIKAALADAGGIDPSHIHFVETHGTGTQLGDPIEVRALAAALGKDRPKDRPLVLGSVKANIGHLEAAAGMAGLVKVILTFQNEKIPAQPHFKEPNPKIDWDSIPVRVAGPDESWPKGEAPRLAGINAFGFSGTNAHIILEEPPLPKKHFAVVDAPQQILTLSANDGKALAELADRYASYLEAHPDLHIADVARTANARRTGHVQRLAVIGPSADQIREKLAAFAQGQETAGLVPGTASSAETKIAFLFTGQGAQYIEMGRQLYQTQPAFRAALDRCDEILRPYLNRSLLSILYPAAGEESPINETAYTQPALFALEYALAELWHSWGIRPSAVMGHSVGEYVAACVSGLFSLEDGLKLIAERGRLMQSLPHDGAMAAVFANHELVAKTVAAYPDSVSIAAINGPENIVISGREDRVQEILAQLAAEGIKASRLLVSHAFHSPLMDPILNSFEQVAASIHFQKPGIALVSNVTGQFASFEQVSQPAYWRAHIRQPVQFQSAIETLRDQGYEVFVEIGPQPILLGMSQRCIPGGGQLWLASLRQRKEDWLQMLESLGALYVRGVEINWEGFHQGYAQRIVPLPTYPFQRQRYWFQARKKPARADREMLHPLIGRKVRSPGLTGTVYETQLGVDFPAFLNDHRVYGTAIFPGTGYIEMALAAARHAFGDQVSSLADLVIREPLVLAEEEERTVQVTIASSESGRAAYDIYSLEVGENGAEDGWKHHASGAILLEAPAGSQDAPEDLDRLKQTCPKVLDVAAFYRQLANLGIAYGPAFQGVSSIGLGDHEAFGRIVLPSEYAQEAQQYRIHPALLDACIQLLGSAAPEALREDGEKVYVPVGLQSFILHQPGQSQVWAHGSVTRPGGQGDHGKKETLTGNIRLYAQDGALVAEVNGLQLRQISRDLIRQGTQRKVEDWLYEIRWQPSIVSSTPVSTSINPWLIFADEGGVGDGLAGQLKAQSATVIRIWPGDAYRQVDRDSYVLDPTQSDHFQQLMADLRAPLSGLRPGIVYLWSLNNLFDASDHQDEARLRAAQHRVVGGALHLVQALAEKMISPAGLWLVTQDVHPVLAEDRVQGIVQASVWGLARTIAAEYPNWNCTAVDLAPDSRDRLFAELLVQDDENQVALRGGERYVARLDRPEAASNQLVVPDQPFELVIPSPGVLDGLSLQVVDRVPPQAGEVEIRVKATGLNFRDVLNALGMYPGAKIPLGIECAGVIAAVGPGVTQFKVGDEVIGLTTGAFRSFATIPVDRVFAKPANLTIAQAVAIPTTYLTAAYGLHHLAGMKAGDRVLIHAAAGGVGLAAVQLTQRAGAEVFGTAGSPEKRAFLKSLGVNHVFDSRSLAFAEQIMQVTQGQGVNIILNSLADEFIPKSLSILADHGCFLEMGKRDDWDQEKVSRLNSTLRYYRYDLGTEMVNDMPFIGGMLREILADFETGVFKPSPVRAFPMYAVRDAFRYMAQAKHIGKIVVTQDEDRSFIREDGTYLITGGLGGLGLVTACWLVERGAKHLVLVGRSAPGEQAREAMEGMRAAGAEVVPLQADISRREDVEGVLRSIEASQPPLTGIFHEAGVLDDGVMSQQTWQRYERVMDPKVAGAWHLHTLTEHLPLDFFVLFSSAAAVTGSAGQSNYAAANAFLDGLAHYRKSHGLPAMSIDWGAWAEVGMAASMDKRPSSESDAIRSEEGMKILERLLQELPAQRVVLPVNWTRLEGKQIQPLLRRVVKTKTRASQPRPSVKILEQIKTMSLSEQMNALNEYARQQVVGTLGLDPSQPFNAQQELTNLGMDSLMAVELKNKIEGDLNVNLPVTYFLEEATTANLAQKLREQLGGGSEEEQRKTGGEVVDSEKAQLLLSNLDQLSEEEVNALLNNLLTNKEEP